MFQTLVGEPRFAAVLHFYAGFTELANHGVRKVITCHFGTCDDASSKISRLTHLRCFFEAQIYNQLWYEKLVQILNRKLDLSLVTMTSLDCMSVGYLLKCFLRNCRKISLNLSNCSIDGHSIGLIIGEYSSAGTCLTWSHRTRHQ